MSWIYQIIDELTNDPEFYKIFTEFKHFLEFKIGTHVKSVHSF